MSQRRITTAAWLVAATSIAWLDPHQAVRSANRLYAEGKYEDAAAAYNAALVDQPDAADLHFNLGDTTYKQGKYDEAVSSFQKVETAGDPQRAGRVAYNVGNTTYRQGQALEQTEPQKALTLYAEALASYRRALGLTPADEDAKFNHELVTKHIEDLKKKLEEQKKDQEQKQQDKQENKDQQQPQDDQQKDQAQDKPPQDEQQQQEKQQADQDQKLPGEPHDGGDKENQPPQDDKDSKQGEQPSEPSEDEPQNAPQPDGEAVAGEPKNGELSKGEAAAILDSQRGEEVSPEDIIKKLQGARVAEPAQDW